MVGSASAGLAATLKCVIKMVGRRTFRIHGSHLNAPNISSAHIISQARIECDLR